MDAPLARSRELFFQGIEHFESDRNEQACTAFKGALALVPGRSSILANLGITLFRLQRFSEAIQILEEADQVEPGNANVLASLGLSHEAQGEWKVAAEILSKALAIAPQHPGLWLTCGLCRARSGAPPSALQAIEKAIEVAPDFAQAWSERGSLLRELHQLDEAARSFEKAIALGADPELHAFYLAAVRKSATGTEPPHRYIESLFDDYANDFEEHLVGNLKYQGYELLIRPLLSSRRRYARVLDLGCGTGLCGKLIHTLADQVDGVDLSRAMLERARQTGFYHELTHADIGEYLATATLCEDLVLAADVFGYLRDLRPIFQSVRRILAPNGCFAFTVELSKSGDAIELLPSLRHTHSESYIRRTAEDCGFRILNLTTAALREDQRDPIAALYVYLE